MSAKIIKFEDAIQQFSKVSKLEISKPAHPVMINETQAELFEAGYETVKYGIIGFAYTALKQVGVDEYYLKNLPAWLGELIDEFAYETELKVKEFRENQEMEFENE